MMGFPMALPLRMEACVFLAFVEHNGWNLTYGPPHGWFVVSNQDVGGRPIDEDLQRGLIEYAECYTTDLLCALAALEGRFHRWGEDREEVWH